MKHPQEIGNGEGNGLGQFDSPEGVVIDSSGNIYVADTLNNRIQRYDAGTGDWTEIGNNTTEKGYLSYPRGLTVDNLGNVYVTNTERERVQEYKVETGSWEEIGHSDGTDLGYFQFPYDVTVDSSGNIYVADTANERIHRIVTGEQIGRAHV